MTIIIRGFIYQTVHRKVLNLCVRTSGTHNKIYHVCTQLYAMDLINPTHSESMCSCTAIVGSIKKCPQIAIDGKHWQSSKNTVTSGLVNKEIQGCCFFNDFKILSTWCSIFKQCIIPVNISKCLSYYFTLHLIWHLSTPCQLFWYVW